MYFSIIPTVGCMPHNSRIFTAHSRTSSGVYAGSAFFSEAATFPIWPPETLASAPVTSAMASKSKSLGRGGLIEAPGSGSGDLLPSEAGGSDGVFAARGVKGGTPPLFGWVGLGWVGWAAIVCRFPPLSAVSERKSLFSNKSSFLGGCPPDFSARLLARFLTYSGAQSRRSCIWYLPFPRSSIHLDWSTAWNHWPGSRPDSSHSAASSTSSAVPK